MRSTLRALAAILVLAPTVACSAPNSSALRFVLTATSWDVGYAPFAVAEAEGYFKAEGITVQFQTSSGPSQAVQLLAQGSADVSPLALQSVAQAEEKGGKLQTYYNFYTSNIYGIAAPAAEGIANPLQLKGQKIGVTSLASGGVLAANAILNDVGLSEKDVHYVAIGVGAQAAQAVKSGQVNAVSTYDTQFALLRSQGIALVNVPAPKVEALVGGGLSAVKERIDANPDLYAKLGRAIAKATVFSIANPKAAVKDVWKLYPTTRPAGVEDKAMAESLAVLEQRLKHVGLTRDHTRYGEASENEVTNYLDFLKQTGAIQHAPPVSAIYTDTLLSRINDFSVAGVQDVATKKN